MQSFCAHAVKKEIPHFTLTVMLFASMTRAICEGGRQPGAQALEGAFGELERVPWSSGAGPKVVASRRQALEAAVPLLSDIFVTPETMPKFPGGNTDDLFDVELLDGLVGMLDRCVVDVEFENPWDAPLRSFVRGEDTGPAGEAAEDQAAEPSLKKGRKKKQRRASAEAPAAGSREVSASTGGAKLSAETLTRASAAAARAGAAAGEQSADVGSDSARLLPVVRGYALVRGVALCNHSCDPNVVLEWQSRAELTARACRSITAGEEVLMSYLGVEDLERLPLAQRRKKLLDGWGFVCKCARCVAEEAGKPWPPKERVVVKAAAEAPAPTVSDAPSTGCVKTSTVSDAAGIGDAKSSAASDAAALTAMFNAAKPAATSAPKPLKRRKKLWDKEVAEAVEPVAAASDTSFESDDEEPRPPVKSSKKKKKWAAEAAATPESLEPFEAAQRKKSFKGKSKKTKKKKKGTK